MEMLPAQKGMHRESRCPSERAIERYALSQETSEELASIEKHVLLCRNCQQKLEAEFEFVLDMRVALMTSTTPSACVDRPREVNAISQEDQDASWLGTNG